MHSVARAAAWTIRLSGIALIILGVLFWTGHALGLMQLHMGLGVVLVAALWVLAGTVGRAKGVSGLVIVAAIWGFVVPAVGMLQLGWVPGEWHWTIRVLHLVIGMAAMGMGDQLGKRMRVA